MPGDRLAKAKSKGKAKPAPSAADVAPPDVLGENAVDRGHLQAVREAPDQGGREPDFAGPASESTARVLERR